MTLMMRWAMFFVHNSSKSLSCFRSFQNSSEKLVMFHSVLGLFKILRRASCHVFLSWVISSFLITIVSFASLG